MALTSHAVVVCSHQRCTDTLLLRLRATGLCIRLRQMYDSETKESLHVPYHNAGQHLAPEWARPETRLRPCLLKKLQHVARKLCLADDVDGAT